MCWSGDPATSTCWDFSSSQYAEDCNRARIILDSAAGVSHGLSSTVVISVQTSRNKAKTRSDSIDFSSLACKPSVLRFKIQCITATTNPVGGQMILFVYLL